jgi:hypothetical protein
MSLNATLASGLLLGRGGENYTTQADLLGFFARVQQWYGDTARHAADPAAAIAPIEYMESRSTSDGGEVLIPVPQAPSQADLLQGALDAAADTHFLNFNVFAGNRAQLEYLRHIGLLEGDKFQRKRSTNPKLVVNY